MIQNISCLKYIYSNGKEEGSCDFPSFIHENEDNSISGCSEGWYPVEGEDFCCPEPNMIIEGDYCIPQE